MPVTPKTLDVAEWLRDNYSNATVRHTKACDHVCAADACIGGCDVEFEKLPAFVTGATFNEADEQMYLVCRQCGEAFDSMKTALDHLPIGCGSDQGWDLLPESEAM